MYNKIAGGAVVVVVVISILFSLDFTVDIEWHPIFVPLDNFTIPQHDS